MKRRNEKKGGRKQRGGTLGWWEINVGGLSK